jgi:NAD(P)-dependent dehydrogenase (short-subunit alcohol dehydrogenase family)
MKTVIVTGASRGIGAAVARRLGSEGWHVVVNYLVDRESALEVVGSIEAAGGSARAVPGDVGQESGVLALFKGLDSLDGLVNNAGITGGFTRVEDLTEEVARRVMEVNLLGTMLCCREAVRRMPAGGSIVNLSSVAARTGSPFEYAHYAATKAAVEAFTLGLAREVGQRGIRVNCVAPGLVDTEIHARGGASDRVERLAGSIPLGRAARPEEIAEGVAWLMSEQASYATGTVLGLTGGR